jgi:hypothetical protein
VVSFGWTPSPPDPRDYPLERLLSATPEAALTERLWIPGPILDQGDVPACTGFAWGGWSNCLPVRGNMHAADCLAVYHRAVTLDGHDPHTWRSGAVLRNALKAMQERGRVASYFRAASTEEALEWLRRGGPLVCGTYWWPSMSEPSGGIMTIRRGKPAGHAYLVNGIKRLRLRWRVRVTNSWGRDWADGGGAWLTVSDFDDLLAIGGEAWAAVEQPVTWKEAA